MHSTKIILLSLLSFLLMTPAFAVPQVKINTRFYDIEGSTAGELREEMREKGIRHKGSTYDAFTSWHVHWNYNYTPMGNDCRVDSVRVSVKVDYQMPRWTNRMQASQDLQMKWQRYYAALEKHEHGHADLGRKAAQEIENAIWKTKGDAQCRSFNNRANVAGQNILQKYREKETDYDFSTQHGRKDGVRFP